MSNQQQQKLLEGPSDGRHSIQHNRLLEELRNHLSEKRLSQVTEQTAAVQEMSCKSIVAIVDTPQTSVDIQVAETDDEESTKHSKIKLVLKKMRNKLHDIKHYGTDESDSSDKSPYISISETEHQNALEKLNRRLRLTNADLLEGLSTKTYISLIPKYSEQRQSKHTKRYTSPELSELGEQCILQIQLNTFKFGVGGWMTIGFQKAIVLPYNFTRPNMCLLYRRTLIIMDRGDENRKSDLRHITFIDEPPFGKKWTEKWFNEYYWQPKYVPQRLLNNETYTGTDDTIRICCILEPLFPLVKLYSTNNGILKWSVDNFTVRFQEAQMRINPCIHSPYFYTSPYGYRVKCRLYPNGDSLATGNHMSVFLDFLVGEWDDDLPQLEQFSHTTTFVLINQTDYKHHHVKYEVNTDGFTSDFFYDFIPHSILMCADSPYIKNDTLSLEITVKPIIQ